MTVRVALVNYGVVAGGFVSEVLYNRKLVGVA